MNRRFPQSGALLITAALVSSAAAGPKWTKPEAVSEAGRPTSFPVVGVDSKGAATAAWMQLDSTAVTNPLWRIYPATRGPAGGPWKIATTPLSDDGAFAPSIAVGGNGAAAIAWDLMSASLDQTQASVRPAGGDFGAAVGLSSPGFAPGGSGGAVALDAAGSGAIAYEVIGSNYNTIDVWPVTAGQLAASKATFAEFEETNPVGTAVPDVVTSAAGAYVAFDKRFFPTVRPFYVGPLAGGGFSAGMQMTPAASSDGGMGRIAVDPSGQIVTAWRSSDGVYAQIGTSVPQRIAPATANATSLTLAAGPDGTVVAAWIEDADATRVQVAAAVRAPSATTFGAETTLSEKSDGIDPPRIAFAGATAIVVWSRDTGLFHRVEEADRAAGGSFGAVARTLSGVVEKSDGDADYPRIAADAAGHAVVVWAQAFTDAGSGLVYDRVVTTTTGFGPPDLKPPKLARFKVTQERFTTGTTLGDIVVAADVKTVMYPQGHTRVPLRAGTQFVFTSSEAGSYRIDIVGIGCTTFLPEGHKVKEHDDTTGCPPSGDPTSLTGATTKGTNRVTYFGATLTPGDQYAATITLTDAAGNVSKSRGLKFFFDAP